MRSRPSSGSGERLSSSMTPKGILVGLGNPIMSDDGIGLLVGRLVHERLEGYDLDLACGAGLHVMDAILGYERAVIIDSMVTGRFAPGDVAKVEPGSGLETRRAGHSHGVGFFEAIEVARTCGAALPREITVYGIEVEDPFSIGDGISSKVADRLDEIVDFIAGDIAAGGR
jgi:hydrogenase maturation protease